MHISKKALFGGLAACAILAGTAGSAFAQQAGGRRPPPDPTRKAQVLAALQAGKLQTGQLSDDITGRLADRIDALVASGVIDGTKLAQLQHLTPEERLAKGAARVEQFRLEHPDGPGPGPDARPGAGFGGHPGAPPAAPQG